MDLFEYSSKDKYEAAQPLPERMRPVSLDDILGQENITGQNSLIRTAIQADQLFSMILWGPPGCGKTTLATIIAGETKSNFMQISAVLSGVKNIREVIAEAKKQLKLLRKRTVLFVDEIHRFNKSQQDAFLYHVESGLITLIGATTENPSFEVIPALLSRCRVITLNPVSGETLVSILKRALTDKNKGFGKSEHTITDNALGFIAELSGGDVRSALNNLEAAFFYANMQSRNTADVPFEIDVECLEHVIQKKALMYDKSGEEHFNLISAFHKSLRGSDPDAAIYWMNRMLMAGEDPSYIIRRMVRFATEDVGMADPNALTVALSALEAYRFLGFPEGEDAIGQAAIYLATAPKSNAVYKACGQVREEIKKSGALPVPKHIRNAPTKLMKDVGYGKGYKYAHDYKDGYVPQDYLPEDLKGTRYYHPSDRGYERVVKPRLEGWLDIKKKNQR